MNEGETFVDLIALIESELKSLPHPALGSFLTDWPESGWCSSGRRNGNRAMRCGRPRSAGTLVHHRSEEPHAMHTGPEPLLALYVWQGPELSHSARLEPRRIA